MAERYADIIIEISHEKVDRPFQYKIPQELADAVYPGVRVHVPFGRGNQDRLGYVVDLSEETEYPIGKYGMLRKTYLQEHRKGLYLELVLAGKLNEHLHQIDEKCNQMMDRLVEQMKEKQGVTEELKMQNQMAWVRGMNNIRACAEEIVLKEIVYR